MSLPIASVASAVSKLYSGG
jgi:hypothetical protein